MRYMLQHKKKKELLLFLLIYTCSQGMLLILSGRWWDDWCLYHQPFESLKSMAMQMGRPSVILFIKLATILPEPCYRIITFIFGFFCVLFTYKILKNWLNISDKACFWICALYAVIPANDVRALLSVFCYTVGLFFFMAGWSRLSGVLLKEKVTWWERISCWILFLFGFTLNSTLVLYGMVLLMILMKKGIKQFYRYLDFVLLPIVFFAVKSRFFPPYGVYAGYNTITLESVLNAARMIILADFNTIRSLFNNMIRFGVPVFSIALSVLILAICNWHRIVKTIEALMHKQAIPQSIGKENETTGGKESLLILVIGIIALSAGLFAYIAVRQENYVDTVGLIGRDSVLIPFGASMILYALVDLILSHRFRKALLLWMIICGALYFNTFYLSYQQDYYRQLGFQYQLRQHKEELKDATNIAYFNSVGSLINIEHFYHLNGNAELVFGDQSRLFLSGFNNAYLLTDSYQSDLDYYVESHNYHMSDYDTSKKRIDAVVQYSFNTDLWDVIRIKAHELLGDKMFDEWISSRSTMNVLLDGTDEYDAFLAANGYENVE